MRFSVQDRELIAGLRALAAQVGRSEEEVALAALKSYVSLQNMSAAFILLGEFLRKDAGSHRVELLSWYEPDEINRQGIEGIRRQHVVVLDERMLRVFSEFARIMRSEFTRAMRSSEQVSEPELSEEEAIALADEQLTAVRIERARWVKDIAARYDLPEADVLEAARRNPRALAAADQVWSRSELDEDEAMRVAKEELRAVRAGR